MRSPNMKALVVLILTSTSTINAFQSSNRLSTIASTQSLSTWSSWKTLQMSLLDNISIPFFAENNQSPVQPRPPSVPPPVSNDPEALFSRAKAIIASDLGLRDPSILADDFVWVGPNVVSTGTLNKEEYIAAGQFFNLRNTFPDLDYRAHDFRLDPMDPFTVRLTARTVGTMRGELRLRSETILPNGKRMICPPEAISMTFDSKSGKLTKLCSGFCMDRLVGNTGGLCGVMAAATVAGSPPSEWELYPPSVVISRFFRRSVKQLKEPDQFFLAPFPESVMIQLTKGVLAAETGTKDPNLLSNDFTFCGPLVGPLSKNEFIEEFSSDELREAFPDLDENYSNFRVDPYDPYRVWYDVKATGTRTGSLMGKEADGSKYIGPPEAASMTFDDDGFCVRMTGAAVMDPTDCNTGGLGGVFGILYASGVAPPPIASRPLPQILSRVQKGLLSPITGKDVDDFANVKTNDDTSSSPIPTPVVKPPLPPQTPPQFVTEEKKSLTTKASTTTTPQTPITLPKIPVSEVKVPALKISTPKVLPPTTKKASPAKITPPTKIALQANIAPPKVSTISEKKSPKVAATSANPSDPVTESFSSLFSGLKPPETKGVSKTSQKEKQMQNDKKRAEEKRKQALAAVEAKKKEAEIKRSLAIAAAEEKRKLAMEKKIALDRAKESERVLNKAKPGSTISLGFFGFGLKPEQGSRKDEESVKTTSAPPRGVPTLRNWRQNRDGSITGLIYGSRSFDAGESVTTSPIQGQVAVNTLVTTKSGSKYFLETKSVVGGKSFFAFGGEDKKLQAVSKSKNTQTNSTAKRKKELEQREKAEVAARIKKEAAAVAARKKEEQQAAQKAKAEAAVRKKEEQQASQKAKAEAAVRKKEEQQAAQKAKAEAAARKKEEQEAAQKAKAEAAARKKEEREAAQKAKIVATKKKQALASVSNSKSSSGTISLGGSPPVFTSGKKEANAPRGVPILTNWTKNFDGSVTGKIYGSTSFKDGDKVTTSKLGSGQILGAGALIVTQSGSKYFLK